MPDHQRDVGGRKPDLGAVDGGERAEGAVHQTDQRHGDEGDRRIAEELLEIEPDARQRPRRGGGRERRRQHGEGKKNGAGHEQRAGGRIAGGDAELAGGQREIGDGEIDGEDGAAALVGGALVQPALDDHERAGEEESGAGAQHDPGQRIDQHAVQKDDDGGAGGAAGEGADVADAGDDGRRRQAAEDESDRPAGAEQTEIVGGETFRRAAQRQEQRVETVSREEEGGGEQEREDGKELAAHGSLELVGGA